MSHLPPTWDDLRVLLAVHRGKSFLGAGKTLGVATSTIARRVATLESSLGRPLVHRGNGGTTLDADALGLVALAEQMELGLDALRRGTTQERVAGTVRVSVFEGAVRPLVRMFATLQVKHPALAFEVTAESRLVDLARREADIGIRLARAGTPTLIEKRAGQLRLAVFGARGYVERRLPTGRLGKQDAERHDWVGLDASLDKLPSQVWVHGYGARRYVLRGPAAAVEEAVVAGMGLGVLGEAEGMALGLVRIDTETAPPPVTVFLAFHRDAKKTSRIRIALQAIEHELRRVLA
jgi:DNA-binding transcriptional LysR family regulator